MKIDNQIIQIAAHSKVKKYYLDLGYEPVDGYFYIGVNDLLPSSAKLEKRICDSCGIEYEREHEKHEITFSRFGIDVCPNCVKTKPEFRKIIQKKKDKAWYEKYGSHPMLTQATKRKMANTCQEKYGRHPMKNAELKQKWIDAMIEKFGGPSPLCDEKIKEKAEATLCKNRQVPTSEQQLKVYSLLQELYPDYQIELNYPFSKVALDICLINDDIKIDVEYDGSYWHKNKQQNDRRRDEFLKNNGFKILRIKSRHCIPTKEQLQEMIDDLLTTEHHYNELILKDW